MQRVILFVVIFILFSGTAAFAVSVAPITSEEACEIRLTIDKHVAELEKDHGVIVYCSPEVLFNEHGQALYVRKAYTKGVDYRYPFADSLGHGGEVIYITREQLGIKAWDLKRYEIEVKIDYERNVVASFPNLVDKQTLLDNLVIDLSSVEEEEKTFLARLEEEVERILNSE